MMVLSGLLKSSSASDQSSSSRPRRFSRAANRTSPTQETAPFQPPEPSATHEIPSYVVDESQLAPAEPDDPDLRELNNSLAALTAIFPDVQIEVFREMLSSFDEESRLAVVTEALLKQKMKWVRGRYRVVDKDKKQEDGREAAGPEAIGTFPAEEKFRSPTYKQAVKAAAYHEFKGLSHSTIKAVLAEHNHSYTRSRPTLVALHSKSWRFSISTLFARKRATISLKAEAHPLVVWQSTGFGSITPTLKSTGCPELDRELYDALIVPLQHRSSAEREAKDHALALEVNTKEAEENGALHDCGCCFSEVAFEELSACDHGHVVCFNCIRHAVKEAVFGQGWSRNVDFERGSLRCLAPDSDECLGCISQDHVRRALLEERGGEDIQRKLDERLADDTLLKSQLPVVRCPFCSYAEVDELYLPTTHRTWQFRQNSPFSSFMFVFVILGVGMIPFLLPLFLVMSFLFLVLASKQTFPDFAFGKLNASLIRIRRRRRGLRFTCQNPQCGRNSCMSCSKAWTDIHICHESSLLALRTQVELAMSLAIKRTCPRCNTSFVKSSGCNKLTCVCGYQMCYVCRKDIGNGEGYRHFCEHFRPNGGRGCTECNKCDLYKCEDDEIVIKKAKEDAERVWMQKEGRSVVDNEDARRNLAAMSQYQYQYRQGDGGINGGKGTIGSSWWGSWGSEDYWERVLDWAVESVIE